MSDVNTHEFRGRVEAKFGPITILNQIGEDTGFRKFYLYCEGKYFESRGRDKGKIVSQFVKFTDTLWKDNVGYCYFKELFPGDEVLISFVIRGRFNSEVKGKYGEYSCWNDMCPASKIEILSSAQRQLYDNRDNKPSVEAPDPSYKYTENESREIEKLEDETNDLPF